ncbi:glycosyltransferase family 2 protein [Rhizosaccharibacter radicis]|uniref:Glycosyltransferase family 2 protein n=1 Tax=Rhizosaccharibacter radicis TaxID=2782605 RepID=A0ABT1VWR0_9PROT|nr:glycosyltransferase family 2 protein [Acetobacteraceae bacterium KSS12]
MANVRVVMMQRDEGDSLARWLAHYGGLFGYPNLSIIDNGSVDHLTRQLLAEAERRGSRIYWDLSSRHDFEHKGGHVANIIQHWDNSAPYDFALPVDCDEILAVFEPAGLTTDHAAIHREFDRLRSFRCALRIDMSLLNVPERPGWFAPDRAFHKGFLPARSLDTIDNGYHDPQSRLQPGHLTTRLTYLHWHNHDFDRTQQRARVKMEGRVDLSDSRALANYAGRGDAPGQHLIELLTMSRERFRHRYDDEVQVFVPPGGKANLLQVFGRIRSWDAPTYLSRSPDVVGYELTPLHHYLRHGYGEGRPL